MLLFLLTCIFSQASTLSLKLHESMTKEELQKVFHVDHPSKVPEYELLWLRSVNRRAAEEDSTKKLRLQAFGKDLNLRLTKNDHLVKQEIPLYSVATNSTGHIVYQLLSHDEPLGETYQDVENHAAILVHQDPTDGSTLYEGIIGHELVLKPLPKSLRSRENEILKNENFDKNHIVYKRNQHVEGQYSDYALMEPGDLVPKRNKRSLRSRTRRKREAPYVIYPEILVIVDYDGYRLHGGDNVQIKRYFISFWNGVDLRYKLLKGPKIRISIAGIIISRGRDATPYLERNRVGRDGIDSAAALTDMGKYLFRERRLPVYDIAVSITKLDMCRRQFPSETCNRGTAGFAYVGGACVVNKRLEKVNSVAIIEDTGGFSGIIVAAHEVGHLLGAVHDGSPPPTYLGGPGAEKCRWEDGFIMSDLRHTEKGFRWSPCSVQSFHHFLNGDTATCLYNSPHEDESLPRVLPGKLLTLDAQCRRDRGTSACFKDERVCAQLFCFDSGSGYCVAYRPAAEGSPCGDGQTCSSGRCILENENIIPDFSSHPGFLRRSDTINVTRIEEVSSSPNSVLENLSEPPTRSSLIISSSSTTAPQSSQKYFPSLTDYPVVRNEPETFQMNNDSEPLKPDILTNSHGTECVDEVQKGPNCAEMIQRYGRVYCGTQYIRKHCCAAHRYLCPKYA